MRNKILTLSILFSSWALGAGGSKPKDPNFKTVYVPGGVCGDGSPFKIHIREGNPRKFVFHLQGGGACWDTNTCYGPIPFTHLSQKPNLKDDPINSGQMGHALEDYTYVYIPYCTGDIYIGTHEANYSGRHPKHLGRINMEYTFDWLNQKTELNQAETTVLYGESAGAIGALLNADLIEENIPKDAQHFLIADSPGLHFNANIWERFSPAYIQDISNGMARNGLRFRSDSGDIAQDMPNFCHKYENWKIGVLQSTQDFIMSTVFGNRSQSEHERMLFSDMGIYKALENPRDRCSSWSPPSGTHVFLTKPNEREIKTLDGTTASNFLKEVLNPSFNEMFSHK